MIGSNKNGRKRTWRRQLQLLIKEYWIELLFVLVVLFGLLMVFITRGHISALLGEVDLVFSGLAKYLGRFSPVDLAGAIIAILALGFLIWRVRVRFLASSRWYARACPKCGKTIVRVHRNWQDRLLSATVLPHARRYHCNDCGWSGLRHRGEHSIRER